MASKDIKGDLEIGLFSTASDGLHDEGLRPLVHDEVGSGFPSQETSFRVQGRAERGRDQLESKSYRA